MMKLIRGTGYALLLAAMVGATGCGGGAPRQQAGSCDDGLVVFRAGFRGAAYLCDAH